MEKAFLSLINNSRRILITSHVSPDADAVSSVLLLGTALRSNFPDKEIIMAMEELFPSVRFLANYDQIENITLVNALSKHNPDLLVMLDGNNFERFSRKEAERARQMIDDKNIKTIVIDHHPEADADSVDVYINNNSPATAMDVYEICFEHLGLKPPVGYAQTAMAGIYSDSGGFKFSQPGTRGKMFAVAKDLVEAGADIEHIYFQLNKYTQKDFEVIKELINNLSASQDYSYSWLSDKFIDEWLEHRSQTDLEPGTDIFINEYIRNIDDRQWGFVVYKNTLQGNSYYSASFRSIGDAKDVSKIAMVLGGGGHKPAAGAKFEAKNVKDAIAKVKKAIG